MSERTLVIGSRGSKLALWQAEHVRARLAEVSPGLGVRVEIIKTTGDVLKTAPLALIGGRGVFTKELEEALLDRRIDLAVHSLKDLPTTLPAELTLAAITEREDARDALVAGAALLGKGLAGAAALRALPRGAVVGTSSLRRLAQLKHVRPDFGIKDLRGNVDTRLRKLDAGEYDAIVLAAAGLRRLGLEARITAPLGHDEMLPAVGQGALGLETRRDDEEAIRHVAALDHPATRAACTAERALLGSFGAGCQVPLAAHAEVRDNRLRLDGLIAGLSGDTIIRDTVEGDARDAANLGARLAEELQRRGGSTLLANVARFAP